MGAGDDDVAFQNTKSGKWLQLKDTGELRYDNKNIQLEPQQSPLWTGGYHMVEGHIVTPSKPIRECQNGWILIWSDYDPGKVNDYDWDSTYIPKNSAIVDKGNIFCRVAVNSNNPSIIKVLCITNTQILGVNGNNEGDRGDTVLRQVLEY